MSNFLTWLEYDMKGHLWMKIGWISNFKPVDTMLGLTHLIQEPTNFEISKKPSCINLIFTDQRNLLMQTGTWPSLDNPCHYQITNCRMNFHIPPFHLFIASLPFWEKQYSFKSTAVANFPSVEHLTKKNPDPKWQIKSFIAILFNIM